MVRLQMMGIALVVCLAAAPLQAAVRYVDSATGYTIPAERVTAARGIVSAPGYKALAGVDAVTDATVYLEPYQTLPELRPDTIRKRHSANAMVIVGVVVDDESGEPMRDVAISAGGHVRAQSDARGVFTFDVPLCDGSAPRCFTELRFVKPGYRAAVRKNVELWPYGDWIYSIRLEKGGEAKVIDDRPDVEAEDELPPVYERQRFDAATTSFTPAAEATVISATYRLPTRIRIGRSSGTVEYRSLDDYTSYVLAAEWVDSWGAMSGGMDSLRAGAVAIRTYGVGFVRFPYAANYDICDTTSCQVYDPARTNTYSRQAVLDTANVVMINASGQVLSHMTEYGGENNRGETSLCGDGYTGVFPNCVADPTCAGRTKTGHGRGMCQYGSARWATGTWITSAGAHPFGRKDWQQILLHYYPNLRIAQGSLIAIGDRVTVVNTLATLLSVRACSGGGIESGINCPVLFRKTDGSQARIVDGPRHVTADGRGHTWWLVEWSATERGWAAENNLHAVPGAVTARGDVDADRVTDLTWRHATSGANYLWKMNGAQVTATALPSVADPAWKLAAAADVDADGRADLVFRNTSTGANYLWLMDGTTVRTAVGLPEVPTSWDIAGAGDVDGDRRDDLIWRDRASGANYVWLMNGPAATALPLPAERDTHWRIAGIGDIDGDGRADLVWRNGASTYVWLLQGATIRHAASLGTADTSWSVAGVGDFDGDRKADVFWRRTDGANYIWLLDGATIRQSFGITAVPDVAWRAEGFGDFNGDLKCDIVWRHTTTGDNYLWLLDGATVRTSAPLPAVADRAWQIATP